MNVCRADQLFALDVFNDKVPDTPPNIEPNVPVYESELPIVADVVATEETSPLVPANKAPCPRDDKYKLDENVDDAVENRPLVNPIVVDVEL